MGPGIGMECCAQNGLHIAEDFFYPEIIDPKTGITLPEGTHGELVLTNLERDSEPRTSLHFTMTLVSVAEPLQEWKGLPADQMT